MPLRWLALPPVPPALRPRMFSIRILLHCTVPTCNTLIAVCPTAASGSGGTAVRERFAPASPVRGNPKWAPRLCGKSEATRGSGAPMAIQGRDPAHQAICISPNSESNKGFSMVFLLVHWRLPGRCERFGRNDGPGEICAGKPGAWEPKVGLQIAWQKWSDAGVRRPDGHSRTMTHSSK